MLLVAVPLQDARNAQTSVAALAGGDYVHDQPSSNLRKVPLHGRAVPRRGVPPVSHCQGRHGTSQGQDRTQRICFRFVETFQNCCLYCVLFLSSVYIFYIVLPCTYCHVPAQLMTRHHALQNSTI